jgi:histidyl-tRNA synthetase
VYVACTEGGAARYGLTATDRLRGVCRVEVDTTGRSLKAQAKSANLRRARLLLVVGEQELARDELQMKDLDTGQQEPVARTALLARVREVLQG